MFSTAVSRRYIFARAQAATPSCLGVIPADTSPIVPRDSTIVTSAPVSAKTEVDPISWTGIGVT
jgi:hypothetical protein